MSRFTEKAETALKAAHSSAEKFGHTYIGSEHLLLALVSDEHTLSAIILGRFGITSLRVRELIKEFCGTGETSTLSADELTPRARRIIENSYAVSEKYESKKIGTEHLLASLLDEKDSVALKMLNYADADVVGIKDEVYTLLRASDPKSKRGDGKDRSKLPNLTKYGKNLTALSAGFDPLIGRDAEIERVIRVLTRKNKNNPCLIGEAGVGKTAIVEGLAARIARREVPPSLFGKEIIAVDLTSMIAGAKYRGDFEERIVAITDEAASDKNIILFIDEIHTIVGAGAAEGAIDAANILKPKLARAEIQLIGATTFSEYRRYIEKDGALERRFQPVTVKEPDVSATVEILRGIKNRYEEHHGIVIDEDAIGAAVTLSDRYVADRHFPDKAIDVLDEAAAKCVLDFKITNDNLKNIEEKVRQIELEKEEAVKSTDFELAGALGELEMLYKSEMRRASDADRRERTRPHLTREYVEAVVSELVGADVCSGTDEKILELGERLSRSVFGQEAAVRTLVEAIIRSKVGIGSQSRPLGIFMFVGESGVGKTALAKALAEELFGDKRFLIRYDMSEFSEQSSVAKFIGSAPGYVGYDDGSSVLERVRRQPYSVVLFDEMEKACAEVKNLFLQIADYGIITDSHGREISFKNTYIILTSNGGARQSAREALGFGAQRGEKNAAELLGAYFNDEFLGRIDEIIPFCRPSKEALGQIVRKNLAELEGRLSFLSLSLKCSDAAVEFIAEKGLGRGAVRRTLSFIKQSVENKIAVMLASGECRRGDRIDVELENGALNFLVNSALPSAQKSST